MSHKEEIRKVIERPKDSKAAGEILVCSTLVCSTLGFLSAQARPGLPKHNIPLQNQELNQTALIILLSFCFQFCMAEASTGCKTSSSINRCGNVYLSHKGFTSLLRTGNILERPSQNKFITNLK